MLSFVKTLRLLLSLNSHMFFFSAFKTTVEEGKEEITFLQTVAGEGV